MKINLLPEREGSPVLYKRGPYYWICPGSGNLEKQDAAGNVVPVTGKEMLFLEDCLKGERLLLDGQNVTQSLFAAIEAAGAESKSSLYAINTTPLKRISLRNIFKWKSLCSNIFLQARRGTMTAIMGASGCGKSVFIRMLAGCNRPSKGAIYVNGNPLAEQLHTVGYVPQGDVLLPELSGKASLNYTLKLFAPYLTGAERQLVISHVAESLELPEEVLEMQIGRPEWQGKFPSGGQRRRISLAHALVKWPEILVLDEPTSGLSASDAENVVMLLRNLSQARNMTVVTSIHTPNSLIFNQFNDLLLLGSRGRICYYGPISSSTAEVCQTQDGTPDELMNAIASEDQVDAIAAQYNFLQELQGRNRSTKQYFYEETA